MPILQFPHTIHGLQIGFTRKKAHLIIKPGEGGNTIFRTFPRRAKLRSWGGKRTKIMGTVEDDTTTQLNSTRAIS